MLDIKQVSKLYSATTGIKDISFTIESGTVAALIGPNGSGKTTLLNILAGILKCDKGEVYLDGLKIQEIEARRKLGYLPDTIVMNPRIKVIDLLYMVSDYKYNGAFKAMIENDLELYGISEYRNAKIGNLSMGVKKKVGTIIAFMGTPDLIILDEPTNGMDTLGILQLKNSIYKAKCGGSAIIVSSHILDFVGTIAEKSLFLKDTRLNTIVDKKENLEDVYKKLYL